MSIKLLTEEPFEFLYLTECCTYCSSESIHVKIPDYWKSHVLAHILVAMLDLGCFMQFSKTPSLACKNTHFQHLSTFFIALSNTKSEGL